MSPLRLAGAALLIAGLPATLFALFGLTGLLDGGSALIGAGLSLGAGAVLGALWQTSRKEINSQMVPFHLAERQHRRSRNCACHLHHFDIPRDWRRRNFSANDRNQRHQHQPDESNPARNSKALGQ